MISTAVLTTGLAGSDQTGNRLKHRLSLYAESATPVIENDGRHLDYENRDYFFFSSR